MNNLLSKSLSFALIATLGLFVSACSKEELESTITTITTTSNDDHGNTASESTYLETSLDGNIEEAEDVDYFEIIVSEAGDVKLYTTGDTDTFGYLYDEDSNEIYFNDDSDDTNFEINKYLEAGAYYLKVKHYSEESTGAYTVHKEFTSSSSENNTTTPDSNTTTEIGTITSSVTGRVWMDRNLGASRVCESYDDAQCYGDYYQWGREADGHEKADSNTTSTRATTLTPSHSDFILSDISDVDDIKIDWTIIDDSGVNRNENWNVCPSGFRVPTIEELEAENIGNSTDAFIKLKLPSAGYRSSNSGSLGNQGSYGIVWSSSVYGSVSENLNFDSIDAYTNSIDRAYGYSVRCLRD